MSSTLEILLETVVIVDTAALLTAAVNLSTEALLTVKENGGSKISVREDYKRQEGVYWYI